MVLVYLLIGVAQDPDGYCYFATKAEALSRAKEVVKDGNRFSCSGFWLHSSDDVQVIKQRIPLRKDAVLWALNHLSNARFHDDETIFSWRFSNDTAQKL